MKEKEEAVDEVVERKEALGEETEDEVERVVVHRVVVHLAHDLTQRIGLRRRTTTITVTRAATSETQTKETMEIVMVVPEEGEDETTTTLAVTKMVVKMVLTRAVVAESESDANTTRRDKTVTAIEAVECSQAVPEARGVPEVQDLRPTHLDLLDHPDHLLHLDRPGQ